MKPFPLLVLFLLLLSLVAAGCDDQPKVDPSRMKRLLGSASFEFHKALNGFKMDEARTYVANSADEDFKRLREGMQRGDYNFFFSSNKPEIDYVQKEALVTVQLFQGKNLKQGSFNHPQARPVETQVHRWEYVNGSWQWQGVEKR